MSFKLPDLPYAANALEPHMSAETLALHHGKHHRGYVAKLEELTKDTPLAKLSLEEIVRTTHGKADSVGIFNNAAQHWNHSFFWTCMKPGGSAVPEKLRGALSKSFGDVDGFKRKFSENALGQFGSGWAWLVESGGKLEILKTANAENPLPLGKHPLLVCDVWEHAYYVDYQNRRADYVKSFLDHLIDWEAVAQRLSAH